MLSEEHFLKLSKFLVELLRLFLLILVVSLETGSVVRVNVPQVNFVSWLDSVSACVKIPWHSEMVVFQRAS